MDGGTCPAAVNRAIIINCPLNGVPPYESVATTEAGAD